MSYTIRPLSDFLNMYALTQIERNFTATVECENCPARAFCIHHNLKSDGLSCGDIIKQFYVYELIKKSPLN